MEFDIFFWFFLLLSSSPPPTMLQSHFEVSQAQIQHCRGGRREESGNCHRKLEQFHYFWPLLSEGDSRSGLRSF